MRLNCAKMTILALGLALAVPGFGAEPAVVRYQLRYDAHHSVYGDIGTYTNSIEHDGAVTVVRNQAHILVKVLGIVMHREDADRTERWQDNRLVAFHGVTTVNGDAVEITGAAQGDDFVITSPEGKTEVPARVQPSNPWSAAFLKSDTMMRADTGNVETVRFSAGHPMAVTIAGTPVQVTEYDVASHPAYKVWLDAQNVPVMFSVDDESGLITFTLVK
jgi:hypothetical protein